MKKTALTIFIALVFLIGCTNQTSITPDYLSDQASNDEYSEPVPTVNLENLEAKVPVLIYHHIRQATENDSQNSRQFIVSPEIFEQQIEYLADNDFQTISFKNLADYFDGKFSLPAKPVIISFDDGLINQYQNAFPVLQKYNLNATFFLFSNPIGRSENYLTWEQVKELDAAGMEIGGHGFYHLFLNKINDAELEKEIIESKRIIEENLGHEIFAFAYPFGAYNGEVTKKINEAGYVAIRDIINGVEHTKNDLQKIKGYFVTEDLSRFKNIIDK